MKRTLLATALIAAVGSANAIVSLSGGSYITFSNYNGQPATFTGAQSSGLENALISSNNSFDRLTATYLGKEAGNINTFLVNGLVVFNTNTSVAPATSGLLNAGSPLKFQFTDTTTPGTVSNGDPITFGSYVVLGSRDGESGFKAFTGTTLGTFDFVLGFNDFAKGDADYDDMVVGFRVTPVPEPETYALMLAGLGVVGFVARRRRQK